MFQRFMLCIVDYGDDVEPCIEVVIGMFVQVMVRGFDHPSLLVFAHKLKGFSAPIVVSQFHLYEANIFFFLGDEIYFISSEPPLFGEDGVSVLYEVFGGELFPTVSFFGGCHGVKVGEKGGGSTRDLWALGIVL